MVVAQAAHERVVELAVEVIVVHLGVFVDVFGVGDDPGADTGFLQHGLDGLRRVVDRPLLHALIQNVAIFNAPGGGGVFLIFGPGRAADDPDEALPLVIRHHGDGHPPVITEAFIDAVRGGVVALITLEGQLASVGLVIEDEGGHVVEARLDLRVVDVLPFTRAAPVVQRRHDGQRGVHRRELVGIVGGGGHRGPVGVAHHRVHHRHRRQDAAEAGLVGHGAGVPVAAGAEHDDFRVDLFQPLVIQPQLVHDAGGEPLGDDIRPGHQLLEDLDGLRLLEVEGDAVLRGGVGDGEEGAALQPQRLARFGGGGVRGEEAHRVGAGGRLHADGGGPVVAQIVAGKDAHARPAELD